MKFKKIFTALLFFFAIIISQSAFSQINYADVKVDELSDAQVKQLMQRAESIGYNDVQLEQMAASQGMKQDEILKLRKRVESIRKQRSSSSAPFNQNAQNNIQDRVGRQYADNEDSTSRNQPTKQQLLNKAFDDLKPKIFGTELFKNSEITFEPNLRLATPGNYVIGPDDQLLIDITGDNEANYDLKVTAEGTIRLEYVGLVAVGGLSVDQARSKIRSLMIPTYPAMRSGRTQLAVNLGNIRSIKVILNGQVTKPGTYTLSSLSSVFNALYASGGPNENGSFRKIQVIRSNKVIATIDVYDFLLNGLQKGNIRLQDQDVINVPVYDIRVEMVGEVKNPAIFETLKGEHFQNVLNFAGGFSNMGYQSKVKVFQNTAKERKITDIFEADFSTYEPKNGDKFFIEPILDRFENRVEISGAVFRPGYFELEKGLNLKQLILKADGLKEDAFMNRGYINRLNPDNTLGLQSFDVAAIMNGSQDIILRREDKVIISSIFDLREEYKVTVQGEVRQADQFPYAENMGLEDAIQMAGGFKEGATPNRVEVSRRVRNSNIHSVEASTADVFIINIDRNLKLISDTVFKLQPYDIISVRSAEGYVVQKQVKIEGEVLYPGTYTIKSKSERISDLIKRAGGLTPIAYTEGASLKRPGRDTTLFKSQKDSLEKEKMLQKARYGTPLNERDGFSRLDPQTNEKRKEEQARIFNLQRATQAGVDTTAFSKQPQIIASDLVGIDLTKILDEPGTHYDLLLEDGDVIKVPKQLQTVKVSGEILNPNNIVYRKGKGFKSYVNGAGGFTAHALKGRAYVKYANGSVEAAGKFIFFNVYPKVKPGAEILVPKKAERERLTAQSWIGIGTAVASLGAIIVSLLR